MKAKNIIRYTVQDGVVSATGAHYVAANLATCEISNAPGFISKSIPSVFPLNRLGTCTRQNTFVLGEPKKTRQVEGPTAFR